VNIIEEFKERWRKLNPREKTIIASILIIPVFQAGVSGLLATQEQMRLEKEKLKKVVT
jgi:hypothetical protein